jgi:hypothetical protein
MNRLNAHRAGRSKTRLGLEVRAVDLSELDRNEEVGGRQ